MQTYKHWDLMDSLPAGWTIDKSAGSPLAGYSFATNGSPLRGGKRALVRTRAPQMQLLMDQPVPLPETPQSNIHDATKTGAAYVFDASCARTVNELARKKFMRKLLADILVDLTICEIEGWCKREYINELNELINGIGRQPDVTPNA